MGVADTTDTDSTDGDDGDDSRTPLEMLDLGIVHKADRLRDLISASRTDDYRDDS